MERFQLGKYRPLNLWGGAGTKRLFNLIFPQLKIDYKMLDLAYSIEGAEQVAAMGFNWVILAFSWAFPPEIENGDYELFRSAVRFYHQHDIRVFGMLQVSNCVYQGSYQQKDWYALDPDANRILHSIGRYYTSIHHPEWQAEVRTRIRELVDTGVDGIYFDSPSMGGVGYEWGGMPFGAIGSYDEYTRVAYERAFKIPELPQVVNPKNSITKQYLQWRMQSNI